MFINPFSTNVPLLHPLKTSENHSRGCLMFSGGIEVKQWLKWPFKWTCLTSKRNSSNALFELILSNCDPLENNPYAAVFSLAKSKYTSLIAKSTSNGVICSRNISRCLMRNKWPLIAPYDKAKEKSFQTLHFVSYFMMGSI